MKITCLACDNLIEPELVLENFKTGWHIMRCPLCALTFVDPLPPTEVISSYYNGMYSHLAVEFDEQKMKWARQSAKGYLQVLRDIGCVTSAKTLLDFGGGLGYYSKAFSEAGFLVTFVEQDPVSANFAREVLKISDIMEQSSEYYFENSNTKYDVVFLRHVVEHSTNPNTLISNINNCLTENGILIIETDNNSGIELLFRPSTALFYTKLYRKSYLPYSFFSLMKYRPFAVDPPRHLYGFRISNLSKMLQRNSLTPIKTKCYRIGHPIY